MAKRICQKPKQRYEEEVSMKQRSDLKYIYTYTKDEIMMI